MTTTPGPLVKNLKWLGIAMAVLGIVSIMAPVVAGSAVVIVIGTVMLVAGVAQLLNGLRSEAWSEKILATVMGVISILAGILVIGHPLLGLGFLTLLLVGYFIAEGVFKILVALRHRPADGWGWLLASGVVSLLLGVMILNQWPISGTWAVGVLVGVNLLGTGMALLTLSSTIQAAARGQGS